MQAAASVGSGTVIDRARAGDAEALASLYRAHGPALYRLAYRLTGTPQDAENRDVRFPQHLDDHRYPAASNTFT